MSFESLDQIIEKENSTKEDVYRAVYFADALSQSDASILFELNEFTSTVRQEVVKLISSWVSPKSLYEFIEKRFPTNDFDLPMPCNKQEIEEYFCKLLLEVAESPEQYEQFLTLFYTTSNDIIIGKTFPYIEGHSQSGIVFSPPIFTRENYQKLKDFYYYKYLIKSLDSKQ